MILEFISKFNICFSPIIPRQLKQMTLLKYAAIQYLLSRRYHKHPKYCSLSPTQIKGYCRTHYHEQIEHILTVRRCIL